MSVLQNANESTLISHSHSPLIHHSVSSFDMLSMAPLIRYLPHSRIRYSCSSFDFFYSFLGCIGISSIFIASRAFEVFNFHTNWERWVLFLGFPCHSISSFSHSPILKCFAGCIPWWPMLEINYAATWFLPSHKMEMAATCGRDWSRSSVLLHSSPSACPPVLCLSVTAANAAAADPVV